MNHDEEEGLRIFQAAQAEKPFPDVFGAKLLFFHYYLLILLY